MLQRGSFVFLSKKMQAVAISGTTSITFSASTAFSDFAPIVSVSDNCGGYLIKDGKEVPMPYSSKTKKGNGMRTMERAIPFMEKFELCGEERKEIIEAVRSGKKDQVLRCLQSGKIHPDSLIFKEMIHLSFALYSA